MRVAQIRVPAIKGLSYEEAETKLHASKLNIRLLAARSDLPIQPGLIIDQVPQPGEEVVYGYSVGVTIAIQQTGRNEASREKIGPAEQSRPQHAIERSQVKRTLVFNHIPTHKPSLIQDNYLLTHHPSI